MSFRIDLTIVPRPIRIWDLRVGERFVLTENGYNQVEERHEIYLKISRTKALLESLEHKPVLLIPKLAKNDIGYKLIENFELTYGDRSTDS